MMKKVWLILLAVVLVFGFAVLGCGGGGGGDGPDGPPDGPGDETVPFEFTGPFTEAIYNVGGSGGKTFVYDDATESISFQNNGSVSGSATFKFNFEDIGYTFNRSDVLIFTYEIEVTMPEAVLTAKNPAAWGDDFAGDSDWGVGKGREYVLGNATKSEYDGPKVSGTWDPATKTGTFEVLMKYLPSSATGIGFAHNSYANFTDLPNCALNSNYSLKITKIENSVGEPPAPPPPPTGTAFFDDAVGLTEGIGKYGSGSHDFDEDTGILTISGNGGFSVPLPAGFTVADTVVIQYACINVSVVEEGDDLPPIKFTKKQTDGWTDVAEPNETKYPTFNTEEVSTITVTGYNAAGVAAGKAFFQTNGTFTAKIKIISVTRQEGAPIKINLSVQGLKPVAGEAPVTTVETAQYTGTVTWKTTADADFTGNFVNGTAYKATIVLTAKAGYTFEEIAENSHEVVGATTVTHDTGTSTLTITAVFPAATAPAPDKTITFTTGDVKGNNGSVTLEEDGSGFTFTQSEGYDWAYAYFKVTFAPGYALSDYSKIDLTFTLLNTTYKPLIVAAYEVSGETEPSGQMAASAIIAGGQSPNVGINQDTAYPLTLDITVGDVDGNSVWIAIRSHAAKDDSYKITDIKFYNVSE